MFASNSRRKAVSNRVRKGVNKSALRSAVACTFEAMEPRVLMAGDVLIGFEEKANGENLVGFESDYPGLNVQADGSSTVTVSTAQAKTGTKSMLVHEVNAGTTQWQPQIELKNLGPFTTESVDIEFDYFIPSTTGAADYFADGVWFGLRNTADYQLFGEVILKGNGVYAKPPKDTNNGRTGGGFIGSGIDSWTGTWHHMKYSVAGISGGNLSFSIDIDNGAYTLQNVVAAEANGNGAAESSWNNIAFNFNDTAGNHDVYFDNLSVKAAGGGGNNGSIAGNVFNDPNSNGTKDGAETGINNWVVYLDTNNNNTLDGGETSKTTDASGNYSFTGLAAGTYNVKQQIKSGYRKTQPGSGIPGHTFSLGASEAATNKNFGNTTNIYIGGTVFGDTDSDGVKDAGENGIAGVVINVVSNGSTVATRTTDAAGFFQVKGLAQGTGEVQIVTPANSTITAPAGGKHTGSMTSGQQNGQLNFGVHSNAAQAPTAPSNLDATTASASAINLTWTDASNNETGFKIDYSTSNTFPGGSTTTVAAGANATSLQVGGLAAGTTYFFRVRATNGTGDSTNSNTDSATTQAAGPGYAFANSMAPDQATADANIATGWTNYKSKFVTANGAGGGGKLRVLWDDLSATVSEGVAYGMILAVYNNDQTTFNGLWNYAKAHFNVHGVMNWKIDSNGNTIGQNGATDGDVDMAFALVVADKKWGGYTTDATTLLGNIMTWEVEGGTFVLKPGDMFGGSNQTNPSYFSPAYYRVFAAYTGNNNWISVANKCYDILAAINTKNSGTGLVPDWCKADGTQAGGNSYDFKYDATRISYRIAQDYAWFGTAAAKTQLDLLNAFFKNIGPTNIKSSYTITGSPLVAYQDAAFIAPAGCAAIASTDTQYKTAMFNLTVSLYSGSTNYYNDSLRLLGMIFMAGRMQPPVV